MFVAAGTYVEVVVLPDGVRLHGGYRNDYLGLVPEAFITAVISSDAAAAPGGAALVLDGVGIRPTEVGGIQFRGADAPAGGLPAFGAFLHAPGPELTVTHVWIRAGQGGAGRHGANGAAGAAPAVAPVTGDPQRLAVESGYHDCLSSAENVVHGGAGGTNACRGTDVSGGVGGSADCPDPYGTESSGGGGRSGGSGVPGGMGGAGAYDSHGPGTVGCDTPGLCCGVFEVLPEYELAGDGGNGADGAPGAAGTGCSDPLGELAGETWTPALATAGTAGGPGGGGGGGGAGGGPQMDWYEEECPWADGLGGGGGGGGAGGCGGESGTQGESGAPSAGMVIDYGGASPLGVAVPRFEAVQIVAGNGGNGGRGGGGGDGGLGGLGAPGGNRAREELEDSLAAATQGGAGGKGGNGGPAGGAGGGCGGSSIGVWVLLRGVPDPGVAAAIRAGAVLASGRGGPGGAGGGGAVPGGNGATGEERDVVVE
ncbi:MAG: hypothetical protein HY907_03030 [Deltaproteobacteria bacterium]|nr:hypothetical protein [Deltaproteobacteria bacterium]